MVDGPCAGHDIHTDTGHHTLTLCVAAWHVGDKKREVSRDTAGTATATATVLTLIWTGLDRALTVPLL